MNLSERFSGGRTLGRVRDLLWQCYRPIGRWWWRKTNIYCAPFGMIFDLFLKTYRADSCQFEIPTDLTTRGFRTRFLWNTYEKEERALASSYLRSNCRILELGACIGVVSCITNSLLAKPSKHVVVEANPKLIPALHRNRDLNHCDFHIEHALVSRTSSGKFFVHDLIVGGSATRRTAEEVIVPVRTVEELEDHYGFTFDTLIIDIEGGEVDFLEENREFLNRIDVVFAEFHPFIIGDTSVDGCRSKLVECGLSRQARLGNVEVWARSAQNLS